MDDLKKVIGRRVREARKRNHLTQEKLAEAVEVTPCYIGMIERGESYPGLELLARIARLLGADVGEFTETKLDVGARSSSPYKKKLYRKIDGLSNEQAEALLHVAEALERYKPRSKK